MENRNITCSYFGAYGTPFHAEVLIDYDDGETLNGCYDHSGYTINDLPIFTLGGVYEYGQPAFFAKLVSFPNEVSEALGASSFVGCYLGSCQLFSGSFLAPWVMHIKCRRL